MVILIVSGTLLLTISQFGGRLSARNALVWWAVSAFLVLSLILPGALEPLAKALGIELVSNLVMASLIFFLFLQTLEMSVENTSANRKMRIFVSKIAAKGFDVGGRWKFNRWKALIVLPCYNEEENLLSLIPKLENIKSEHGIEYCFVNDGSTDSSEMILNKQCPDNYVSHEINIGVSGVLMTGFNIAKNNGYDFVVQCDSDGQHPLGDVTKMINFAQSNKVDLTIGSRFRDVRVLKANRKSTTAMRIFGIGLIRFSLGLFGLFSTVKDPTSGFRVYSRKAIGVLANCMPDEYPEPESLALMAVHQLKVAEISVSMNPRVAGVSSITATKKIRYMVKVFSSLVGLRLRSTF
ncbi:DUF2304 family protein [Pseudobacteriovorax antillogorgiicola]|nr:DUF2304 family protein [Pseudobacteriovorax antillogorgiicola]